MEKIEELTEELMRERAKSERLKNLLDRANSEAAHCKRVLKDYQEEEQKRTEKEKKKDEEIFRLNRELEAIKYSKEFSSMGMSEKQAIETARAFLNGDTETFDNNLNLLIKETKKRAQDDAIQKFLENRPEVCAGNPDALEYSAAENIALKHVQNIKLDRESLKNFE